MDDYRSIFYAKYQTAFKHSARTVDYEFNDGKLIPLMEVWCQGIDRSVPCLDLGCGDGSLLHTMKSIGFMHCHGVDASAEQIELAKAVTKNVVVGDIFEYLENAPDNHFGLITLFDVIEHLNKEEIVRCVGLIFEKLRPNGLWVCHLPNGDSPFIGRIQFGDFTHETMLDVSSAKNLCEVFGFAEFDAKEHLGTSNSVAGIGRFLIWQALRMLIRLVNCVETGSLGPNVLTRVFAFKAQKK